MPTLEVDGATLYYEVAGTGPALVFAHGASGNHLSWWQQVPHFQDRYTCVPYAHRGSQPSTGSADPRFLVDDLAQLVDHLGLLNIGLVGQSLGAWTGLGYALAYPERVRALVMSSAAGLLRLGPAFMERMRPGVSDPRPPAPSGVHPAAGARMAREQPALHYLYTEIARLSDRASSVDQLRATEPVPIATVAALSMPVLCLLGDEDPFISSTAPTLLRETFPGWDVVGVPRAGHSVHFERPAQVNAAIDTFLARHAC
ncbi:MAG: alpha/beta hydrolase [Candidatus Limnocylindrales bacterium]